MCGISVFISKQNKSVIKDILRSLDIIQNRGYDSVGIAFYDESWKIEKYTSQHISDSLSILKQNLENTKSTIAIGHTRWATHGPKTKINAHPHISQNGKIIIVHNGIITNYKTLTRYLKSHKVFCTSETDSEVVANLIEFHFLNKNCSIKEAIKYTTSQLEGTWALAIIYTGEINKVYVTRHGSPLLLGESNGQIICCSEVSGFIGLLQNYIVLQNDDIIEINEIKYKCEQYYLLNKITNKDIVISPEPFEHWTLKEISEQPETIFASTNNGARILNNEIKLGGLLYLDEVLDNKEIDHIIGLGCGTSYHATMLLKYYFQKKKNIIVQSCDASEFSEVDIPSNGTVLIIVCSQSGETRDLINAIHLCKKKSNCILLGVVNAVDSMIPRMVDCGVYINAGSERAVASTKSFTSMLISLSLISLWFGEKYNNIKELNCLRQLPNKITELIESKIFYENISEFVRLIETKKINNMFILGCGKLFPIAKEATLKIKEISYIHAEAYSGGSLKHGPFALLDKNYMTILFIDEKNKSKMMSTYNEIISRNTNCYIMTDIPKLDVEENCIYIPTMQFYNEIVYTVACQYMAYYLSLSRNINPDKPRNLAKVVTVE